MVFHYLPSAAKSFGRGAAESHCDKIALDVSGSYAVHKYVAQEAFKVGTNFILCVECAIFFIYIASAVECRVGGHETKAHESAAEYA